jgi:serine/threonine protein kinase
MVQCNSPFILKLFSTYKDSQKLYLLMEFCQGGELFTVLHTPQRDGVSNPQAKFYAVCVLLGLQHMASKEIAYRDLKPENALVDKDGYVKIIDM